MPHTAPETRTHAIESAMRRALDLASRGPSGNINPQVGCVILSPDLRIIAEGWHRGSGTPHAETDALSHLPVEWRDRAHELTAVVTLEPCNHTGRTGPCALALIDAGIGNVVYALGDPGEQSSGGADRLRSAGITVTGGVLALEARRLLAPWLAQQQHTPIELRYSTHPDSADRPHVIVKWAQTLDGRAAAHDGSSQWITGPTAREHVHAERALADAIAVGSGTLVTDNPSLTARDRDGGLLVEARYQPIPVVFGTRDIPENAAVLSHPALTERGLDGPLQLSGTDLARDLAQLGSTGIRSLYVEGGPTLVSSLLREGLADEVHLYLAPKLLGGDGVAIRDLGIQSIAETLQLEIAAVTRLADDVLITAVPRTESDR